MQVESEKVGEVAVVAEPIGLQAPFEFLVAVFAFATVDVGVVGGFRQDERPGAVGYGGSSVGPLGVGFTLENNPTLGGP